MKIMIVDDSTAMRMIVKKTLRQAGFDGHDISEADDGAKALPAIKAVLAASQLGAVPIPATQQTYNLLGTLVKVPQDSRARQVFEMTIGVRNMAL